MKVKRDMNKVIALLFISTLSLSAFTQQGKMNPNNGRCMLPDISEEQQAGIEKLRTEHMKQMTTLKAEARILKAELEQLAIADEADMKKINSKIDELTIVKGNMNKAKHLHRQNVRKLLTEEQRAVFDSKAGKKHGNRYYRGPNSWSCSQQCINKNAKR